MELPNNSELIITNTQVNHRKEDQEKSGVSSLYKLVILVTALVSLINFIMNISHTIQVWNTNNKNVGESSNDNGCSCCCCTSVVNAGNAIHPGNPGQVIFYKKDVQNGDHHQSGSMIRSLLPGNGSVVCITEQHDQPEVKATRFKRDDRQRKKKNGQRERELYDNPRRKRKGSRRKGARKPKPKSIRQEEESSRNDKILHLEIDSSRATKHLRTGKQDSVIEFWKLSDDGYNRQQNFATFHYNNGTVTVLESGYYFIYSQLTYFDKSGRWSHAIDIANRILAKCLTSEWGMKTNPDTNLYFNTVHQCYTGRATYVTSGQVVSIKSMYVNRTIHADSIMSFWGLIKL